MAFSRQPLGIAETAAVGDAARSFLDGEGISNVALVVDDLFDSKLEPHSFDLVHARYSSSASRSSLGCSRG